MTPVAEVAEIAHDAGALAWVDAVHYGPHGPIDVVAAGADVLLCSPYKFYGPHLGLAFGRRELLESWRPYKVRPADPFPVGNRYETGTLAHELLAGFVAAVEYLDDVGWDFVVEHEHELGQRFLDGLPSGWTLHGIPSMDGRVPTFALTHPALTPEEGATRLGKRGFAVWHGNYYAVEIMQRLGLPDGAVRVGIVHYNTAAEVDRLLGALGEIVLVGIRLAARLGPREPGARRIGSGSIPRASATASVSRWNRTMSTTGCSVGTRSTRQPSVSSAATASAARSAARPSPSSTYARTDLVDRGEVPVQDRLRLVRRRVDPGTLTQLERSLLCRRPVAARADEQHA